MANDKKALLPLIVALVASLLCFCSPLPAFADEAEDDSPAYEVWQQYQDSSVTEYNLYKKVAEDLAYRWFMADDTKRANVPLQSVALGSYKQLSQYAEDYDTSEEQWQAFYDDFHPSFMVRMYSLVTYEDSLSTWSVSDSYAYQHFKEWYEHFEGAYSGGSGETEGGIGYYDPSTGETRMVTTFNRKSMIAKYNGTNVTLYNVSYDYDDKCYATLVEGTVSLDIVDSGFDDNGYEYLLTYEPNNLNVWLVPQGSCEPVYEIDDYGNQRLVGLRNVTGSKITLRNWPQFNKYLDVSGNSGLVNATIDMTATIRGNGYGHDVSSGGIYSYTNLTYWSYGTTEGGGGGSSDTPIYPGTPEPEAPEQPTPSNPVFIDNDTTTTTVDLDPILEAIRRLNSNVITGFETLNENMNAWLENASDWLETIWDELRSTNAWLERIFYKTGGGSSSGPDITIDNDGWWGWLSTIAGLLLGDLAGAVSGLAGAFDVLRGLFPFSIPWDLAALLGLFVSEPVTPVFDLPVPFGYANGALQSASVHVDLSAWDNVMVAVRSVELAIFALGLALKTRELLKNAEVEQ